MPYIAAAISFVIGQAAQANDGFHPAASAPEIALETVLFLAESDWDLGWFATDIQQRDKRKDPRFAPFFTASLKAAWARAEKQAVQENCGGTYVKGDDCGIGVHPITCAQDMYEAGYIYRTDRFDGDGATISYRWPTSLEVIGRYRLAKQGERWLLDGVSCRDGMTFNMAD